MNVSISICPTDMECSDGSRYDEQALLEAIREFVLARHPDAKVTTLQVGHRQGDAWSRVDGDDEAGDALIGAFWEARGGDDALFVKPAADRRYPVIRNSNFASREDDLGQHVAEALALADRGCEDCDLTGSLDDLEAALAAHAESDGAVAAEACREAEEAVEAALLTILAAMESDD
jgi:hypothetical protein